MPQIPVSTNSVERVPVFVSSTDWMEDRVMEAEDALTAKLRFTLSVSDLDHEDLGGTKLSIRA